jgi:uncharacterized protein YecT (DUF1311 family)
MVMRAIALGTALVGSAFFAAGLCDPLDDKDLAGAFELGKTCPKECSNETVSMVRLPLPSGKVGFLVTTNDQGFCGSSGCLSAVVVVTGNRFTKIKEDQGITKNQAITLAAGEGDVSSVAAGKPSFDCTKATSASARLICSDAEVSKSDAVLGTKLKAVLADKDEATKRQLLDQQVKWIRGRNTLCALGADKVGVPVEQLMRSKPCMLSAINARIAELSNTSSKTQPAVNTAMPALDSVVTNVRFDPQLCRDPTGVTIRADVRAQSSHIFMNDSELNEVLRGLWGRLSEGCVPIVGNQKIIKWINLALLDERGVVRKDVQRAVTFTSDDGLTFRGERAIGEALVRIKQQQEAAVEQQRQQVIFQEARRQQAEQARQQEIAQAKIDAQSGDPLIGNWKGNANGSTVVLRITKDGNLYLVHGENRCCDLLNGDWAGPYKDNQILISHMLGVISVLQSSTRLTFGGVMYQKVGP